MRVIIAILAASLLGCAATNYVKQPWVKMPIEEANAHCRMESSRDNGPDFEECMFAQGWRPAYRDEIFDPREVRK